MRHTYGISLRSRALGKLRTFTIAVTVAWGLYTLINLFSLAGSPAHATPEQAVAPGAATSGAAAAGEAVPATLAANPELVTVSVLGLLVLGFALFRMVLAPFARGEYPLGRSNPGL